MKRADFILVLSLAVIAVSLVFSLFKGDTVNIEGYSQSEVDYLLKIQSLENEKKHLKYEIEKFKESIIQDSIFVHNATNDQIDSLFTNYFK